MNPITIWIEIQEHIDTVHSNRMIWFKPKFGS